MKPKETMTFEMNEIILRFPHLMEQILQKLDNEGFAKSREVARSLQTFIDTKMYSWLRIVKIPTILNSRNTYLHLAAKHGQIDMFKVILARETDKDLLNDSGFTPFLFTCLSGRVNIAKMLIKKSYELKIDLRRKNRYGDTAFHLACIGGKSELAELIMKNSDKLKVDVNEMNFNFESAFSYACQFGHFEIVKMILDKSEALNFKPYMKRLRLKTMNARYGFKLACSFGHINIVQMLLDRSEFRKLYLTAEDINAAFNKAFCDGYTDIVKLLIGQVRISQLINPLR